jgi:hypothetical protein
LSEDRNGRRGGKQSDRCGEHLFVHWVLLMIHESRTMTVRMAMRLPIAIPTEERLTGAHFKA